MSASSSCITYFGDLATISLDVLSEDKPVGSDEANGVVGAVQDITSASVSRIDVDGQDAGNSVLTGEVTVCILCPIHWPYVEHWDISLENINHIWILIC